MRPVIKYARVVLYANRVNQSVKYTNNNVIKQRGKKNKYKK